MSPEFPNLISNYANQFADGRPAKSTSIGIKDEEGQICGRFMYEYRFNTI